MHSISQKLYIIWFSLTVHMCKIIPPDIFFHFLKILIFWVVRRVKGKKRPKMTKKHVFLALYPRNHTSYDTFMLHMCKRIISPGFVFTFFPNFHFCGQYGKKWTKIAKNHVCHTSYPRKHTSYDCDFCYTFVRWWYLQ